LRSLSGEKRGIFLFAFQSVAMPRKGGFAYLMVLPARFRRRAEWRKGVSKTWGRLLARLGLIGLADA